ncbi:cytochrome P450 family protein [Ceratobasidium sp. AG-Ba]|nr:cytochrome P450 family protein [Ceratobasidium sp. AG-Ba]QRW03309.1 cytochrome P450 family protein [Ceratobasidium sp. AG-Ba]
MQLRTGWDQDILFLQYGERFKQFRALLQRAMNKRAALDYIPMQQHEIRRFMRCLVQDPEKFVDYVHLMAASIAIGVSYGYKTESIKDHYVKAAEGSMVALADFMSPGKWAVDICPPLRYLPTWFPFFRFHQHAKFVRHLKNVAKTEPFEYALKRIVDGTAEVSFTSKLLIASNGQLASEESKEDIRNLAAGLYGAGSDTIAAGVKSFFLAMTLYPNAQTKAETEISNYLQGQRRMILPSDRESLPYTSALVRELLRWHPITNLVARQSNKEDCSACLEDKTHRIPAHSVVVANVWRMMHDPFVYPEPDRYVPGRYLVDNPPPGPENYAFGFGRRICSGLHVAQNSLWIIISNITVNFNTSKAKDARGMEITPEESYTDGVAKRVESQSID